MAFCDRYVSAAAQEKCVLYKALIMTPKYTQHIDSTNKNKDYREPWRKFGLATCNRKPAEATMHKSRFKGEVEYMDQLTKASSEFFSAAWSAYGSSKELFRTGFCAMCGRSPKTPDK